MKNIFSDIKDYVKQPNRNVFDMSFQNNATFNFGTLYPVFCKEVIPGDSVSIDTTFALRFLPMAFPVQTKVQANLHFFYVRNRNLWDNWKKFITHTDDVEFPVLDGSQSCLTTGGLADYLGVPTTRVGALSLPTTVSAYTFGRPSTLSSYFNYSFDPDVFSSPLSPSNVFGPNFFNYFNFSPSTDSHYGRILSSGAVSGSDYPLSGSFSFDFYGDYGQTYNNTFYVCLFAFSSDGARVPLAYYSLLGQITRLRPVQGTIQVYQCNLFPTSETVVYLPDGSSRSFSSSNEFTKFIASLQSTYSKCCFCLWQYDNANPIIPLTQKVNTNDLTTPIPSILDFTYFLGETSYIDISSISNHPFNDNVPLSALPFRAYESIYNSFYRNELNDPLFVDGKPTYDVYCPNTSDGVDDYAYKLYNRNWELDFLTSAVQSPQQGIAPLVGVSSAGNFTFVNKDSNGNVGYFTADAQFSSDGTTITGFKLSDKVQLSGIPTTDVGNVPDDIKRGTIYNLNQMALAGISINDFRNVNALQRWLETNIRRGYKYRDQIKSHFGVDVSYQELDMPEFIGGISEPVFVNQVNQTTETESDPLGSYAGQMSLLASSNHTIRHYADEHGFIMGIMSITPVPNYSQLLPKHFIKYNYLDYFFPEFGHIGMQPIDYREVCPLQAYGVNPSDVNNTFGYQRAWYDYIASVDEVHGLFRTNLRNFVLNRQFDTLPKLNKDFLQVDANQLNDIFTVQDISDKILGQIKFNCIFKRPIPKYGIPRLE